MKTPRGSQIRSQGKRTGSVLEGIAPSNVYQCSDGEYLIVANQDAVFGRLCEAMGRPELASEVIGEQTAIELLVSAASSS